jgi:hypothetical protein
MRLELISTAWKAGAQPIYQSRIRLNRIGETEDSAILFQSVLSYGKRTLKTLASTYLFSLDV